MFYAKNYHVVYYNEQQIHLGTLWSALIFHYTHSIYFSLLWEWEVIKVIKLGIPEKNINFSDIPVIIIYIYTCPVGNVLYYTYIKLKKSFLFFNICFNMLQNLLQCVTHYKGCCRISKFLYFFPLLQKQKDN